MKRFWQDASFRGAPFHVESFEREGGRRGPDHEFPNKEEGYSEDTGGKMEGHSIEAYVALSIRDPDYASRRDALIEALKQKGPGELVHPAFGTIKVQVRSWKVSEEKNRLGVSPFQIQFMEANKALYPSAQQNPSAQMPGLGSSAHDAAGDVFNRDFQVGGKSDFLTDSAVECFKRIADAYGLACSLSGVAVNVSELLELLLSQFWEAIRTCKFSDFPNAFAAFPRAITGHFEEQHRKTRNSDGTYRGISRLRGNGPVEPVAVTSLFPLFDFTSRLDAPERDTATRRTQYENAEAVAAYVRRTAVIEAARVAVFVDWRTLDDAEQARDRIADALEREAWEAYDDDLYSSLSAMRTLLVRTMSPDNSRLPSLMDYTPGCTQPSLVLSHRLYGTADKADELSAINGLRHPGFFPGGEPIRILSNA